MGASRATISTMRLVLVLAAALCVAAVTAEYSSVEEDVVPETSLVESATASVAGADVTRRSKRFRVCRYRARRCHKRVARSRLAKRAKSTRQGRQSTQQGRKESSQESQQTCKESWPMVALLETCCTPEQVQKGSQKGTQALQDCPQALEDLCQAPCLHQKGAQALRSQVYLLHASWASLPWLLQEACCCTQEVLCL